MNAGQVNKVRPQRSADQEGEDGGRISSCSHQDECKKCWLKTLDCFSPVKFGAVQNTKDMPFRKGLKKYPAGTLILLQGRVPHDVFMIYSGWAISYFLLPDGRRQIVNIYMPGDFIGRAALLAQESDSYVETISHFQGCVFDPRYLLDAQEKAALNCQDLLRLVDTERWGTQDIVTALSQRSALEGLAYLLSSLHFRLNLRKLNFNGVSVVPLTQAMIAHAIGLSPEHLNRVLKQLKETNLACLKDGKMTVQDPSGLYALANFVPRIERQPLI